MRQQLASVVGVALALLPAAGVARAQWTATNLHPPGNWAGSVAFAASGAQQAGAVYTEGIDTVHHAGVWSGTAASWVDLEPDDAVASAALGIAAAQQVGYIGYPFGAGSYRARAALWTGAPSPVFLHPAGAAVSEVNATSGPMQVGVATIGGVYRASLWSGTAESWVDLHPVVATGSIALGVFGDQQVGRADFGTLLRASLWTGTAASWIDLHPDGATASVATSTNGAIQAGYAEIDGARHASLWRGLAGSWADLNPAGAATSEITACSGVHQAGYAVIGGVARAGLWTGTPDSWEDLGSFASGFADTYATGIWSDGTTTHVTGHGFNMLTHRYEAILWTRPPACPADLNGDGVVDFPDYLEFLNLYDSLDPRADLNDDGVIDFADYLEFLNHYDAGC